MSDLFYGVVSYWDEAKSFGIIKRDDGGQDVFVHERALAPGAELQIGDKVSFSLAPDRVRAIYVDVL
jgi:cold shock protein